MSTNTDDTRHSGGPGRVYAILGLVMAVLLIVFAIRLTKTKK